MREMIEIFESEFGTVGDAVPPKRRSWMRRLLPWLYAWLDERRLDRQLGAVFSAGRTLPPDSEPPRWSGFDRRNED